VTVTSKFGAPIYQQMATACVTTQTIACIAHRVLTRAPAMPINCLANRQSAFPRNVLFAVSMQESKPSCGNDKQQHNNNE
jgi:hypothetical protein